jgi:hypothetical protein
MPDDAQASMTFTELAQLLDGVAIESQAGERALSPRDLVGELPPETCRLASPRRLLEVLEEIAAWGPVTIPLATADGIVEFTGPLPVGQVRNGHFYWLGDGPLRDRLRIDRCDGIAFVERAFMGRPSASVLFFNRSGDIMFKVFLIRDDRQRLDASQLAAFRALANRVRRRPATARTPRNPIDKR